MATAPRTESGQPQAERTPPRQHTAPQPAPQASPPAVNDGPARTVTEEQATVEPPGVSSPAAAAPGKLPTTMTTPAPQSTPAPATPPEPEAAPPSRAATAPAAPPEPAPTESASPAPEPAPATATEDALRQRARQYWTARREEDWPTLFLFEDTRGQEGVTEEAFIAWGKTESPFRVHDFELRQAVADGQFGWVELQATTSPRKFPNARPVTLGRWEKWHSKEGVWMPVPDTQLEAYPEAPARRDAAAEALLRERFHTSWQARLVDDWKTLYDLTDPRDHGDVSFDKFTETHELFDYRAATVHWVQVLRDTAAGKVHVSIEHKLTDPSLTKAPPRIVTVTEAWVLVDGAWYLDLIPRP